jgi:hypothetical protein
MFARSMGSIGSWKREPAITSASNTVMLSTPEDNRLSQPRALATRRAADDGRAFRTREDPGLYARFRWEYARHDSHKPHRRAALRAVRFAHEESSAHRIGDSSNKSSLDGGTIIHTRSCNLGVPLTTRAPGQSRGGAGASLLTAVRLSWRVDLLTRLIDVPLGDSSRPHGSRF